MDHSGKQRRGRVTLLAPLAALVIVAGVSVYFVAAHPGSRPAPAIDFSGGDVPREFHSLRIGMSMAEVRSAVGKAQVERTNPQFEVKPDAEWTRIKSELDSRRAEQMDEASVPDPAYLKLGREYEHRVRTMWVYYPARMNVWASLQFDGSGKLINAASGPSGKESGPGGKASAH